MVCYLWFCKGTLLDQQGDARGLHHLGEPVLVFLIAIHIVATVWHQVFLRDNVVTSDA